MVPPPRALPIPDGLIQTWTHYEYFKRNSIEVVRKSICDAVFCPNDETARLVTAAWQPAEEAELEPKAKRAKPNPENLEAEAEEDSDEGNPDIIITPDVSFTNLDEVSDFEDGEEPERIGFPPDGEILEGSSRYEPERIGYRDFQWPRGFDNSWEDIRDHGHARRSERCRRSVAEDSAMCALFKKFAQDEIKFFEKKRGSLEETDIIQLLACRKNCKEEEKTLLDIIKLPIKKIKNVTDYWKTKVEIYRDPESEKHLNFQFWHDQKGCYFWTEGENVRYIHGEPYQDVAAQYVTAMMKHPKMRFKELIFDIEPWYKGPAEFPDFEFHAQLRMKLHSALGGKKVKVRHLFIRTCFSHNQKYAWIAIVPVLRRKWLKLITLRIWDDEHVDQRRKRKRTAFSEYIRQPGKPTDIRDAEIYGMPKAWKSATRLDYRDENLANSPINWLILTTFRSIQMLNVHWEAFDDIINALKEFPPRQTCTISVETKLNLKDIKWYFSNKEGVYFSQGFVYFLSNTGRRYIMIKLKDRKIIIDTEKVLGQELDDIDQACVSSDDSWTEKNIHRF